MRGKWEYREQWIDDNVHGSTKFYRYWYEDQSGRAGRKRTPRRQSLKTSNFEEAKDRLVEQALKADTDSLSSLVTAVLAKYAEEVLRNRPKGTRESGLWAMGLILDELEGTERIAVLTEDFQEGVMKSWRQKHGHAATTISRNLTVLSAAIGHSRIKDAPKIFYSANYISKRLNIPGGKRRWFPTDDDDFARFIDGLGSNAAFYWTLIAMNTVCRPEAALDLGPAQINVQNGLVDLNPEDRPQNDKYRPVVRLTENLAGWAETIPGTFQDVKSNAERALLELQEPWKLRARFVPFRSVDSLQSAYTRTRKEVGLLQMVPYSIRHKMTTVLRSKGVSEDHVSLQLGHRNPEHRTTRLYGEFDPAYLADCANAIDEYIFELNKRTDRDLFAKICCKSVANDKIVQLSSHREI